MVSPPAHIHLIGIGGAGLSAIARVLLGRGYSVSGSDQQAGPLTEALAEQGATVYVGHRAEQIDGAQMIVRSSAIPDSNPEVAAGQKAGVPVLKRFDFLGDLMRQSCGIAVAGTHGKTTTTGMISHLLIQAEKDPSVIVGGILPLLGTNGRSGSGPHFVIEADEYDHMFLGLRPEIAIITNIEHDHPDIFPDKPSYDAAFRSFVNNLPADGTLIVSLDDPGLRRLLKLLKAEPSHRSRRIIGYGLEEKPDLRVLGVDRVVWADALEQRDSLLHFRVSLDAEISGAVALGTAGRHNVANALAALAVGFTLDIPLAEMSDALKSFTGMGRRFEIKGMINAVSVVDDYAHHPSEIAVVLDAARTRFPSGNIVAVWQPHTFSRVALLYSDFQAAFKDADEVIVLDIYKSRETDTLGISASQLAADIDHPHAHHLATFDETLNYLLTRLKPNDAVIVMNAGNATELAADLVTHLHLLNRERQLTSDE
ncbi:MAG: UDP-N-acetylmuramate--L-alanine ligase [Chloroflexota bacterium]